MKEYINATDLKIGDFFKFNEKYTWILEIFRNKTLKFIEFNENNLLPRLVGFATDIEGRKAGVFIHDKVIYVPAVMSEEFE